MPGIAGLFHSTARSLCRPACLLALLAGLSCLGAAATPSRAHPHIWISATVTLQYDAGAIAALRIDWTFDDMYSTLAIEDFDRNRDGRADAAELAEMAAQSAESLKDFSFFTYLKIGDRRLRVDRVAGLEATVVDDLLRYSFVVPLPEKVDPRTTPFGFSLYDETYYVDVALDGGGAVRAAGEGGDGCKPVPTEDEDNPIYFGSVYPLLVQIRCDVS